jgi:hypothetical protein
MKPTTLASLCFLWMLLLLSSVKPLPSKGFLLGLCDYLQDLCMKSLFLLGFLELEPSKGFSFGFCNFSVTVLCSKARPLLGFSPFETLKGFLDLCDLYRVSTHTKVLSVVSFSASQTSKGINPFLSLRWRFGALLASTYSRNSLLSLQGIQQPCEGPPMTLLFSELRI